MLRSNPTLRGRGVFALLILAIACHTNDAHGSVDLTSVSWEFYQGGFVSDGEDFRVIQDHFRDSPPQNVVNNSMGGASMESAATMTHDEWQSGPIYEFSALATFELSASVEQGLPGGAAAEAFGGLSAFSVSFQITNHSHLFEYNGPELESMGNGEPIESGDILEPGEYQFFHVDPFPGLGFFWDTESVGPGESDQILEDVSMNFTFTAVPAPATLAVFALAGLGSRGRQRRFHRSM